MHPKMTVMQKPTWHDLIEFEKIAISRPQPDALLSACIAILRVTIAVTASRQTRKPKKLGCRRPKALPDTKDYHFLEIFPADPAPTMRGGAVQIFAWRQGYSGNPSDSRSRAV